jgi:hypothetical protein
MRSFVDRGEGRPDAQADVAQEIDTPIRMVTREDILAASSQAGYRKPSRQKKKVAGPRTSKVTDSRVKTGI